jgi:hypothetical protein
MDVRNFWKFQPEQQQHIADQVIMKEPHVCKHPHLSPVEATDKYTHCLDCDLEFEIITPCVLKPVEVEYAYFDIKPTQA